MSEIPSKLSSALSAEWLKARSPAKRMSENFDGISDIERSHLPDECNKNSKTTIFKPDQYNS